MEHPEVEEDGRMVSPARVVGPGRLAHAGVAREGLGGSEAAVAVR